jgi:hypothetical protein
MRAATSNPQNRFESIANGQGCAPDMIILVTPNHVLAKMNLFSLKAPMRPNQKRQKNLQNKKKLLNQRKCQKHLQSVVRRSMHYRSTMPSNQRKSCDVLPECPKRSDFHWVSRHWTHAISLQPPHYWTVEPPTVSLTMG